MNYGRTFSGALLAAAVIVVVAAGPGRADTDDPLTELVDAAAQRLALADPVAAFKWHSALAVEDPDRVQRELSTLTGKATAAGIDPDYVTGVMQDQINATESLEYSRFAQWKLDPGSASAAPTDLSVSRATIDDLNNVMLAQIEMRWDVLHSPGCAAHLDDALGQVSNTRRLDGPYQQALRFATRSYCQ
ncbi:chorismate mutase [Mycobacterium shimoidei]|uniref:chorismate mutase n=1 Tax=Mycobacterium shimoidei TaxID=29313 RepID=UPI00084859B6|nr:chorismate mutase [Mycobacterium shimoidei]MCV7259104.1 chorismate mutase [Mycobacterium shimoidei]ODR13088.1 chorismate mutase [Mycobacterium shimoidei]ORW83315.1 chorismate mutase [Mycobacterium shimoidei]